MSRHIEYKHTSIDCSPYLFIEPNRYGYITNLAHPVVNSEYRQYRAERKIPPWAPLSDNERYEFDRYIIEKYPDDFRLWQEKAYDKGGRLCDVREAIITAYYGHRR